MDPLSQGLLGAAAAQLLLSKRAGKRVWLYGALGGMAPDLDILIRSSSDPLLHLEYHRHFTHALPFIPFGGVLSSLPFLWKRERGNWCMKRDWRLVLLACVVGYATHGLLDLCTSYGTVLLWPFSAQRFALDWVAIIDPAFTLPLGVGVFLTARRSSLRPVVFASIFAGLYLCFGAWQHQRGIEAQRQLAAHRGINISHQRVMPTLASLRNWRAVYRFSSEEGSRQNLQADALVIPFFGPIRVIEGERIELYRPKREDFAEPDVAVFRAIEKFRFFSGDHLAYSPQQPDLIGDMRYSFQSSSFDPIWGITIDSSTKKRPRLKRLPDHKESRAEPTPQS